MNFYKAMVIQVVTYASEIWPVCRKDKKVQSSEMRCLKNNLECTLLETNTNTGVRKELNTECNTRKSKESV